MQLLTVKLPKTDQFQKQCLTAVPDDVLHNIYGDVQEQVGKVQGVKSEKDGYECSVQLLNKIVDSLKKHYPKAYQDVEPITFIAKSDQPPRHHPRGYSVRPDIIALQERIHKPLEATSQTPPWHHLLSVGEWKPGSTISGAESGQEREYVGCATQARPDNPSILGIIMCPGGYILSWGSPCGYVVTEQLALTDIDLLIRYVHSLHAPLPAISFADRVRSITLDATNGPNGEPRWFITDRAHEIDNRSFSMIFIGSPFTRMTTVFINADNGPLRVVKIMFPNVNDQREVSLYDLLGEDAPGWPLRVKPEDDKFELQSSPSLDFDSSFFTQRGRDWLVLNSTGDTLERCECLSEAVGVIYDVLEANRWAITRKRILHRDISPRNILIHPQPPSLSKDDACFIKGVYEGVTSSPSLSILLDIDNGVKLPDTHLSLKEFHNLNSSDSRELKALTGTPMYIARGPSFGQYQLDMSRIFGDMPKIEPREALELYLKAYPDDTFRELKGAIGSYDETLHAECQQGLSHTSFLIQRPWHDAESAMLVFLIFLLRCRPKGSAPESEKELNTMQDIYLGLRRSAIGSSLDNRRSLLRRDERIWRSFLHTGLQHVAPFLVPMCEALEVDYEFLVPAKGVNQELVLHEIFQRQLFTLYYKLRKGYVQDVEFDTSRLRPIVKNDNSRPVHSIDHLSSSRYSSDMLKRKEAPDGVAEPHSDSQKRPRSGRSSSSRLQSQT